MHMHMLQLTSRTERFVKGKEFHELRFANCNRLEDSLLAFFHCYLLQHAAINTPTAKNQRELEKSTLILGSPPFQYHLPKKTRTESRTQRCNRQSNPAR